MLVAGIDAGQSSTTAAIADESGRIIARGSAGPADEIGQSAHSTRLRDALGGAIQNALHAAKLPNDSVFEAIVAGISGYEGTIFGAAPHLPVKRLQLMHDAPIAHAAALGGKAGVVVIAGTGSVAYMRTDDGREALTGGWGYLFGDEGSAFWIVRKAVSIAATHEECTGIDRLLSFFDVHSMRELVRGFYVGKIARDDLASFAPLCIEAAKAGDTCSCLEMPVLDATKALADLAVEAADDASGSVPVAFTGGLMHDGWFKEKVYVAVRRRFAEMSTRRYEIVEPALEPVLGAVLLALRAAGVTNPAIA